MAKPSSDFENKNKKETLTWGTSEELLLSCAVHRYGTDSWDSVAMELQKRSSAFHLLTAEICEQKFLGLKQRFNDQVQINNDDDDVVVPWLDELKKLRVAELKRDLERYDLSIVSLQLKVKRLKEERDNSDLTKSVTNEDDADDRISPAGVTGKEACCEISDRGSQSMNESNSTDPKEELGGKPKEEPPNQSVKTGPVVKVEGSERPARVESCDGSSDTVAKESAESPAVEPEKVGPKIEPEDFVADSVNHSGGDGGGKENSDIQSSVKSEAGNVDQSPAIKSATVGSLTFVDLLEILQSHKLGSIFQHRLSSQDTTNYRSLIRQHIDLETIRTRLQNGWYSTDNRKLCRDLLLLSTNALVFYGNKSSESMAAIEFRQLIYNKMASSSTSHLQLDSSTLEQITPPPLVPPSKPDPEPSDSMTGSEKVALPLTACCRRSSVAAKASIEKEKLPMNAEKRLRERTITPKNSKNREPNLSDSLEPKTDNSSSITTNKRGAASFLNKKKNNSLSLDESFKETLKTRNSKADIVVRRDQSSLRRGNTGKQIKEQESSAKKNVGRLVKKIAALPPPPAVLGKRSREGGGSEVMGSSRLAKKRSRK